MRSESAINSWRNWDITLRSKPLIIGPLNGGRSNRSFLLESDGKKMVLRINGSESVLPGTNRKYEYHIWQAASAKGIAPPLLYADEQSEFLVSTYIDDRLPPQPAYDQQFVANAFDLLKRCHQLDVDVPFMDYGTHIENYWQIIESKTGQPNADLEKQRKPMHRLLRELINRGGQTGLCHHDPVIENFVGSPDRLYLIDWEYALNGLLIMDYAALGVEWRINGHLLTEHSGIELELMTMATDFYKYLCELWEAATA